MSCSERSFFTASTVNSFMSLGPKNPPRVVYQDVHARPVGQVQPDWAPVLPGTMNQQQSSQPQESVALPRHQFHQGEVSWRELHMSPIRIPQVSACPFGASKGKDDSSYFPLESDEHSRPLTDVPTFTRLMTGMSSMNGAGTGPIQGYFRPDTSYQGLKLHQYGDQELRPTSSPIAPLAESCHLYNLNFPAQPCPDSDGKLVSDNLVVDNSECRSHRSDSSCSMTLNGSQTNTDDADSCLRRDNPLTDYSEAEKTPRQDTQGGWIGRESEWKREKLTSEKGLKNLEGDKTTSVAIASRKYASLQPKQGDVFHWGIWKGRARRGMKGAQSRD